MWEPCNNFKVRSIRYDLNMTIIFSMRFVMVDARSEQTVGDSAMDVVSSRVAVSTPRRK